MGLISAESITSNRLLNVMTFRQMLRRVELRPLNLVQSSNVNDTFSLFFADLQFQLQVLREWLKRMEDRVPKLELKPKWNREILEQRIVEFKVSRQWHPSFGLFRMTC